MIDPSGGFAYFGTTDSPGIIVRIGLGNFTESGSLTLNFNERFLASAVIDVPHGFAYFGAVGFVVKVQLSSFTETGSTATPSSDPLSSATIDTAAGAAYFGTQTNPGQVFKVNLS